MSECFGGKFLSVQELSKMIGQENVVVVDIRDRESYERNHISGALWINGEQNIKSFLDNTVKSKTIVCCCYHGISSQKAADYLKTQGFEDVYSLEGGFEGWKSHHKL